MDNTICAILRMTLDLSHTIRRAHQVDIRAPRYELGIQETSSVLSRDTNDWTTGQVALSLLLQRQQEIEEELSNLHKLSSSFFSLCNTIL